MRCHIPVRAGKRGGQWLLKSYEAITLAIISCIRLPSGEICRLQRPATHKHFPSSPIASHAILLAAYLTVLSCAGMRRNALHGCGGTLGLWRLSHHQMAMIQPQQMLPAHPCLNWQCQSHLPSGAQQTCYLPWSSGGLTALRRLNRDSAGSVVDTVVNGLSAECCCASARLGCTASHIGSLMHAFLQYADCKTQMRSG